MPYSRYTKQQLEDHIKELRESLSRTHQKGETVRRLNQTLKDAVRELSRR